MTWANNNYAIMLGGRAEYGDGPFVVDEVFYRPYIEDQYDDGFYQSNWSSMGHTQHISVIGMDSVFSGAFFKKVD